MSILRAQTTLEHASGIPANNVTNTMYFDVPGFTGTMPDLNVNDVMVAIKDFYSTAHTFAGAAGGTSLKSHFSTEYSVGSNHIFTTRIYDLDAPLPRVPLVDERWATTVAGAAEGVPAEVALVASFQGLKVSGLNQKRRRGRIFLPACKKASAAMGAGSVIRPTAAYQEAAVGAMAALQIASQADVGWTWVVYSPTDDAATSVASGWVDDSFDTMRSRGAKPTSKILF